MRTSEPKPHEINKLLVSFDSEVRKTSVRQNEANFGIGTLARDGDDGVSSDPAETILLTIFLKHDQSKNLEGIQGHLAATGWWTASRPRVGDRQLERVMGIRATVLGCRTPSMSNVESSARPGRVRSSSS